MDAFTGTRGAFGGTPGVAPTPEGEQAFTVTTDGARLANYRLSNYKAGIRQKSENSYTSKTGITVENIIGENFYRFWDTVEGQETYDAICRNVRVVGFERSFIRWFSVERGLIEDCYVEGIQGGAYIAGIQLEGKCHNVTIRRTEVRNVFDAVTAGYNQGDSYSIEGGQTGIVLEDTRGIGAGDAVYDVKPLDLVFRGTHYAEDAGRCFRFHRSCDTSTATLIVYRARGRGYWWAGKTSQYPDEVVQDIAYVIAMDPNGASSLFRFESGPASVRVLKCDIHKGWRGIKLQENGGSGFGAVTFPNGCSVEQTDGSWITYDGAPPVDADGRIL
ncbi:hypothetical protein ACVOMT_03395 [Sphingomonas panni]